MRRSVSIVGTLSREMSSITPRTGKSGQSTISPAGIAEALCRATCSSVALAWNSPAGSEPTASMPELPMEIRYP